MGIFDETVIPGKIFKKLNQKSKKDEVFTIKYRNVTFVNRRSVVLDTVIRVPMVHARSVL